MARVTTLLKICEYCENQFESLDARKRFCNRSCAASWNNARFPKREPARPRVKQKTQVQKWLDGEWDGNTRFGLSQAIRRYLLDKADYKCSECGWSGFNPVNGKSTLQIEHIDGDSSNNEISNLKVLCPNCHSLTPTYGALNKGRGRTYRHQSAGV